MNSLQSKNTIREPAFAGQFYPGTKSELNSQLTELFRESQEKQVNENLRAIISPHAGYMFSGGVAASAFNQIPPGAMYKRVFVLASSHSFHFSGAAIYASGNYRTPLGNIKVDTGLAKKLIQSSEIFQDKPEAHDNEHSLEVQLPFLQQKLKSEFLLVPIILGTNKTEEVKQIAEKLSPFFTKENLFVISTDFSHYPKFKDAQQVDNATAESICKNNPSTLLETLEENKQKRIENLATSLCGWTSVLTLLYLTENKNFNFKKLEYRNSGHAKTYGDKHRVVGYWAIAVTDNEEDEFHLTKEEQKELLQKARNAIETNLKTGKRGSILPPDSNGIINSSAGAFVSVYVKDQLRGCIGSFAHEEKLLNEVVQNNAVSATKDIRFDPVILDETDDMELEISVLSPMKKIDSIDEIELGKHGIYIKKGVQQGTFLPQVADKTGWNLTEFLGHCARDKAGLGWEGWKNAEIFVYEAFVFREKDFQSA